MGISLSPSSVTCFPTYRGCASTHRPLGFDTEWIVHQGFSIDIEGCCGASCYARESALYRSYGDCVLYCRKREFFKIGCGMVEWRGEEESDTMEAFLGLVVSPQLIAHRVIGSKDAV